MSESPLISPRSPSYARAREELRHPSPTGDPEVVAVLARLSEAEENARRGCARLAGIVGDETLAEELRDDASTHQARREALVELIEALGGSAPRPEECRVILRDADEAVASARSEADAVAARGLIRTGLRAVYAEALRGPRLDEAQRAAIGALGPEE